MSAPLHSVHRAHTYRAYSLRSSASGAALGSAAGLAIVRLYKLANVVGATVVSRLQRKGPAAAATLIPSSARNRN
jgi:hypothetical protein